MVTCVKSAVVCLVLLAGALPASAIELLTNGNFEAPAVNGRPSGWTTFEQSGSVGRFYLDQSGTTTPAGDPGFRLATPTNNVAGVDSTYAVSITASDTTTDVGPGAHALSQTFSLPGNATSIKLRYQLFVRDYGNRGDQEQPSGLDYTSGGTFALNQIARVDILKGTASPLSTTPSDIIKTSFKSAKSVNEEWEQHEDDLTGLVQFGQTYTVRFGVVSNQDPLVLGVDNVSLSYTGTVIIPEVGTGTLFALPLLLLVASRLRKRRGA